jgi:hypothetical protein
LLQRFQVGQAHAGDAAATEWREQAGRLSENCCKKSKAACDVAVEGGSNGSPATTKNNTSIA